MLASDVLVTGAGGFLGRAVLRELPGAVGLGRSPRPGLRAADLADAEAARRVLADVRPRVVVHVAGAAGRGASPETLRRDNVQATRHLLEALPDAATRIVYVSTSDVYPGTATGPLAEDAPTGPLTEYGRTKLAAEGLVLARAAETGREAVILRPFLVYGPGERPDMLLAGALDAARRGLAFETTPGEQLRDPVFVEDVARAVARAATVPVRSPLVVNVGRGEGWKVADLVRACYAAAGSAASPAIGARPYPATERWSLVADPRGLARALGVTCGTSLPEGLRRTLEAAP